jgi:hypothetical protein
MRSGIRRVGAVATLGLVLAACAGDDESNPAATPASSSSEASSPTSTRVVCPNPEGGSCLGPIAAGTYTTKIFSPTLTFRVPDGWSNFEDTPGNFLLVPAPYDLPGVNADTSDFIGVYSTIAAPNGCDPGTAPGVGLTPEDLNAWYERHPGLDVTSLATTIGGRRGFVLDVRMRTDWTTTCPYSNGNPVVPMLVGTGMSGLEHNIGAGRAWRLYLLNNPDETMAIEVVDVADAGHLDAYAMIVEAMVFDR